MKLKTKSPLPWFGTDAGVARTLAALFDACRHVTIPFCGGMSILPWLKATHVVANDLHEEAFGFYRVASGNAGTENQKRLIEYVKDTLSHPACLERARRILAQEDWGNLAERAWAFWAESWLSAKGSAGTDRQRELSVRWSADGGSNASRLRSAAEDLPTWAEMFKRCEFACLDFRECLAKVKDRQDCGVYCDPPWFEAGDAYRHKFTEQDHRDLRDALLRFRHATVLVRLGGDARDRKLYSEHFHGIERKSRGQANNEVKEVWYTRRTNKAVSEYDIITNTAPFAEDLGIEQETDSK